MTTLFFSFFFLSHFLPAARPGAENWRAAESADGTAVDAERIPGGEFGAAAALFLSLKRNLFAASLYAPACIQSSFRFLILTHS